MVAPTHRNLTQLRRPRRAVGFLLADVPAFSALAQEVEDAMPDGVLHYRDRLRLLQRARHFGIKRFDANLVIAMVQNRVRQELDEPAPTVRNRTWLRTAAVVLVLQSAILAGAWWVMR